MGLKCEACGLVNWSNEAPCKCCGAEPKENSSSGTYSERGTERERALRRHLRLSPFFKALLYSFATEFVVFAITGRAMVESLFRHSGDAPGNVLTDLLANFGFLFHLPSILITLPFYLVALAPLVQIALMTGVLTIIFRLRRSKGKARRLIPYISRRNSNSRLRSGV